MKQVVLEIPEEFKSRKVTLEYLLKDDISREFILWFHRKYGTECELSELAREVGACSTVDMSKRCVVNGLLRDKNLLPVSNQGYCDKKFVCLDDVSDNKLIVMIIYSGKYGHAYKLQKHQGKYYWMSLKNVHSGFRKGYSSKVEAITNPIYNSNVKIFQFDGSIEIKDRGLQL